MSCAHLFKYMINLLKKFLVRKTHLFLIFIILNGCAVNNKMMLGSEVAEIALPLSFQCSRKYRIVFCGDWFECEGFGRIEGSILSALILEKKIKDLIK